MSEATKYRFSFGPWNISEGADPFGPEVRSPYSLEEKLDWYLPLGFEGVQFHDDDVVEGIDGLKPSQVTKRAQEVCQSLKDRGLVAEFVAPRLWFDPKTIDGGFTSNCATDRAYALDRCLRTIDIAREMDTPNVVLWLAREGTYIREAKNARVAYERILETINKMLDYDPEVNIWIEPKPNEPMDHAYLPTIGHAIAIAYQSSDPTRVGGLIESAHAILAGLDPADEMAFALAHGKLCSVHLNDQNGLKFDQDKSFGSANLRSAYNQVRVLEEAGYGKRGEFVGLDVKIMRTQKQSDSTAHLANSRDTFLHLVEKVRTVDRKLEQELIEARDYEALDAYTLRHLLGVPTEAVSSSQQPALAASGK
ncbi:MAG: TIM barrel protein [Planctomycetes bacterium]|nr:TIM barrel protein [Planctomycetota bacterium]